MSLRATYVAAALAFSLLLASSVHWMTLSACRRDQAMDAKQRAVDLAVPLSWINTDAHPLQTEDDNTAPPSSRESVDGSLAWRHVRRCTRAEADAQAQLVRLAQVKGCGGRGDYLMRIVHLHHPRGTYFIDIGSNKGYSGAHFFQLWEPEYKLDPKVLQKAVGHSCGVCQDCNEVTAPIVALGFLQPRLRKRQRIRVFSFDGSTINANNLHNGIARLEHNYSIQGIAKAWTSENAALADKYTPGATVRFVSQREIGHIAGPTEDTTGKTVVVVPVLTVDHIIERDKLEFVAVVKIDTEGYDQFVIHGAERALRAHRVLLLLFEYHYVWPPPTSLKNATAQLEDWGYVCYLEGQHGLLRLNYDCWNDALEVRTWSNVWCLSTRRRDGLAIASAFDALALLWL